MALDPKNAETLAKYYECTNVGDFQGALKYLSDDVVYVVPGPSDRVPYSGRWEGKGRVILCFQAFNAAFGLVDMAETRTITSANDVFSINDEIFTSRGTGRPWRVGVVHHITFDKNALISSLVNYTDIAPAIQALGGQTAIVSPMLQPDRVAGEDEISSDAARAVVEQYYKAFPNVADLLDDSVTALVPGDPRRLRFSGTWRGPKEVLQMTAQFAASVEVNQSTLQKIVANNGGVVAVVRLQGLFRPTKQPLDLEVVDFFQVTGPGKIGRMAAYIDTFLLTKA